MSKSSGPLARLLNVIITAIVLALAAVVTGPIGAGIITLYLIVYKWVLKHKVPYLEVL